jgi:hypothetical protein
LNEEDVSMIIEVDKDKLTSNIRIPKTSRKRSMSDDEDQLLKANSKSRRRSISSSSQESVRKPTKK